MSEGADGDVLIFDLGGVLVDFQGFDALQGLLPRGLGTDEIRSRWIGSPAVSAFERGALTPPEFATRFVAEWDLDWSPQEFLAAFREWAQPLSAEARELLSELGARHRIACLSNCSALHWERLRGGALAHFDAIFLSFEMGVAKPDPRIYEMALQELGVPAGAATLFDDSEENLHSARRLGIGTERVRGLEELRGRLVATGRLAP